LNDFMLLIFARGVAAIKMTRTEGFIATTPGRMRKQVRVKRVKSKSNI